MLYFVDFYIYIQYNKYNWVKWQYGARISRKFICMDKEIL